MSHGQEPRRPSRLGLLSVASALLFAASLGTAARAEDWPQIGGPRRDGTSTETGLADHWPEGGPRVVWEIKGMGGGYSNPVVVAGRVFVIGRRATGELKGWVSQEVEAGPDVLWCLDRTNGKVIWKLELPLHVKSDRSTAWSTPAVDGERVYARGGDGEVRCLSVKDGKEIWRWPADEKLLAQKGNEASSGYAGGLTVVSDLVLFQGLVPGGRQATLVAADKKTGAVRWSFPVRPWLHQARNPTPIELKGKTLLLVAGQVLDPPTGKKLGVCPGGQWWDGHHGNRIITRFERQLKIPKAREEEEEKKHGEGFDREAGVQCLALDLKEDGTVVAGKLWEWSMRGTADYEPKGVKAFGGPIITGGHAYTFIGIRRQGDRLLCLDMATGKERWRAKVRVPLGTSHPLYADGKILVLNDGRLAMIAADPKQYRDLGHARVSLRSWAAPALSDGHLFLRDDSGTVKCLDLRAAAPPTKQAAPPPEAETTDWPQAGGPRGDGTSSEKGLPDRWPEAGPKVVWEARTEPGFAGPVVADGRVFLLGQKHWGIKKDKQGKVVRTKDGKPVYDRGWGGWASGEGPAVLRCLDRRSGKERWAFTFQPAEPKAKGAGPYVTPAADGDRVYALGGARELVCLRAADGKVVWRHVGSNPMGEASDGYRVFDPLVVAGDRLLCSGRAAGSTQITAVDKATGQVRWTKYFEPPHWRIRYATPRPIRVAGRLCLLLVGADVLVCLGPRSEALWESPRVSKEQGFHDPRNYLVSGNRFWVQRPKALDAYEAVPTPGGQGVTCRKLWTCESRLGGTLIASSARLFVIAPGNDGRRVHARDAATGKLLWDARIDKAELSGGILVDGKLILTTRRDEIILAQATGPELKVLARARITGFEACGATPAYSNGQLLLRDCSGLVKCLDVKTPSGR